MDGIKEIGVMMSPPMVQGLLHEVYPKLETRRHLYVQKKVGPRSVAKFNAKYPPPPEGLPFPYMWALSRWADVKPGDRIWVREAWQTIADFDAMPPSEIVKFSPIKYCTDSSFSTGWAGRGLAGKKRPSMFMPRWASRITLEVVATKIDRLQDISVEDALLEGIAGPVVEKGGPLNIQRNIYRIPGDPPEVRYSSAVAAYGELWARLNSPEDWMANPWVVAVRFKRVPQ